MGLVQIYDKKNIPLLLVNQIIFCQFKDNHVSDFEVMDVLLLKIAQQDAS